LKPSFVVSIEGAGLNPLGQVQKDTAYLSAADKTKDPQAMRLYEAAAGVQAAQGAQIITAFPGNGLPPR
jgi:hypothetical protein